MYHEVGSLLPQEGEDPKFAQIYFYDSQDYVSQLSRRYHIMERRLNLEMLSELQNELHKNNPFVHTFVSAGIIDNSQDEEVLCILIHNTHGKDMRQYNAPMAEEVAAISLIEEKIQERDILIKRYNNKLERISELNGAYDPLQYPLLFPFGEYGWHDGILRANISEENIPEENIPEENIPEENIQEIEENIEQEEGQTGTSQVFDELTIRSFSSISEIGEESQSKRKGKMKEIEIESDDNQEYQSDNDKKYQSDNNQEYQSNNEIQ